MTTTNWQGGNGDWANSAGWSGGLPNAATDAAIGGSATETVTIAAGESDAAHSLTLSDAHAILAISGTLAIGTTLAISAGEVQLDSGGIVSGGTILDASGAMQFEGGTLEAVSYQGAVDLTQSFATLYVSGGLDATGLGGTGPGTLNVTGEFASLYLDDNQTLDNAVVNLGLAGSAGASIYEEDTSENGATLTLGPHLTIEQTGSDDLLTDEGYPGDETINQGTILATAGALDIDSQYFVNSGSIALTGTADVFIDAGSFTNEAGATLALGAGTTLDIATPTWSSLGTITIGNGADLLLGGSFTQGTVGAFSNSGGTIGIEGTLSDTGPGSTPTLAVGSGSVWGSVDLDGVGTIVGGVIQDPGAGMSFTGGTLDGVTYEGAIDMLAADSSLYVAGTLDATGTAGSGAGTIFDTGNGSTLYFDDDQTVNNARITLGATGASATLAEYDSVTAGHTLTLGASLAVDQRGINDTLTDSNFSGDAVVNQGTIAGHAGTLAITPESFSNSGTVFAISGSDIVINAGSFVNQSGGTLNVSSASTIAIDSAAWSNAGTITVGYGANLHLGGAFTQAQLGQTYNNGTIFIDGTLNDSGGTFHPSVGAGAGRTVLDATGTIAGDTIVDPNSNLGFAGGTFHYVTYDGPLGLTGTGAALFIQGKLVTAGATGTGPGTINVTGSGATLTLENTQTLDDATLTLGGTSASAGIALDDTGVSGATLTLGTTLTVDQIGKSDTLGSTSVAGDLVVNRGTIDATSGTLDIDPLDFTNLGTIALNTGGAVRFGGAAGSVTNLASGTLAGGTYLVGAGSTLTLPTGGTIATLATDLVLSGAGSAVKTTTGVSLDQSLVAVAATGTLGLGLGRSFAAASGFTDNGTVLFSGGTLTGTPQIASGGAAVGFGEIASTVTDSGRIEASAGLLDLAGAVSGTGSLVVDNGATLELDSTIGSGVGVDIAAGGTLLLKDPTGFAGTIDNAAALDWIDFGSATITSATITASALDVVENGTSVALALANPTPGLRAVLAPPAPDGDNEVVLYGVAEPSLSESAVNFGIVHVGSSTYQSIIVKNAATGTLADVLEGGFGTLTGSPMFTGSGSLGTLAPGYSGSLKVTLNTGTAGTYSGSAPLDFISHDTLGADLTLTESPLALSATVDNYAYGTWREVTGAGTLTQSGTAYTLNLGTIEEGAQAAAANLEILNAVAAPGDELEGTFTVGSNPPTEFTNTGLASTSGINPGSADTAPEITLATSTTGSFSETITFAGTGYNASGYSGALTPQKLTVTGTVAAATPAKAVLSGSALSGTTINFGIVHIGSTYRTLTVTNGATGAIVDLLEGQFGSFGGSSDFSGSGSLGQLASGRAGSLRVTLNVTSAGTYTGTAALAFTSNDQVTGSTALAEPTLTLTGTVDNSAYGTWRKLSGAGTLTQSGNNYTLNLGSIALGATAPSVNLEILNSVAAPSDQLEGTFAVSANAAFTNSGFGAFSGINAGQADTAPTISLSTGTLGTFTETVTLDGTGYNASGYSGALSAQTLTITGTVVNTGAETGQLHRLTSAMAVLHASDGPLVSPSHESVEAAHPLTLAAGH